MELIWLRLYRFVFLCLYSKSSPEMLLPLYDRGSVVHIYDDPGGLDSKPWSLGGIVLKLLYKTARRSWMLLVFYCSWCDVIKTRITSDSGVLQMETTTARKVPLLIPLSLAISFSALPPCVSSLYHSFPSHPWLQNIPAYLHQQKIAAGSCPVRAGHQSCSPTMHQLLV